MSIDRQDRSGEQPVIELKGLSKHYREVTAVDNLDLTVRTGEIYGFLGRNGAGKTTTIRMMLGLIRPSSGSARLFGHDLSRKRSAAVASSGSLVETATLYPTLTVRENLDIQRRLMSAPESELSRCMKLLNIEYLAGRRAGRLSLGNKQRLAIARAMISSPRLLVLDEPANGLDPAGIVEIRDLLRGLAEQENTTVFVSSHILGEISQLATRIGIIHEGRLIEEFHTGDWLKRNSVRQYRLVTSDNDRALKLLSTLPGMKGRVREVDGELLVAAGAAAERGARLPVTDAAESGAGIPNQDAEDSAVRKPTADKADSTARKPAQEVDPELMAETIVSAGLGLSALIPQGEDLESYFLKRTGGEL